MRIVHFIWSLELGGAESLLVDILTSQSACAEVGLVIGNAMVARSVLDSLPKSIHVASLDRRPGSRDPRFLARLFGAVHRFRPDVVHAHNESAIAALRLQQAPVVLTVHRTGGPILPFGPFYDRVFAISQAVQRDILHRCGPMEVGLVPNGIRCSAIKPRPAGAPASLFRILQVGRLVHQIKGQDILLHSLALLRNQYGRLDFEVDFIGEGTSLQHLQNLAAALGISGAVRFLGVQPRAFVYDCLSRYDALVQPSRSEGFGLTIAEAMVARVPVVVSDIEGPMELIQSGRYGLHFRHGNPQDLARVLHRLRESPPEALLDHARDYAQQTFDIERTAQTYLRHYHSLLSSGS